MEHRCGNRLASTAGVWIRTHHGISGRAQLRNISASGALIRTLVPVPLHAQILVRFTAGMLEDPGDRQWISAHVVRHARDGVGIEWTEFSPEVVRQLLGRTGRGAESVASGVEI
jgi:hypothetical protein